MKLGVHVSIAGSLDRAVDRAFERNCGTFQMFTRNPRGWKYNELTQTAIQEFKRKVEASGISPPVVHMPYLPNLASPKTQIYKISLESLVKELERCTALAIPFLVTHLGSHLGMGQEEGFERIVKAVNMALSKIHGTVMILLENTAGTTNSMGSSFHEVKKILEKIEHQERVGVCFDTCHAFAAGYDLRNVKTVNETISLLDKIIGLDKLKVVHLNDSKGDLKSGLDRHEHIGLGKIGEEGFSVIVNHEALKRLPMILETPIDNRRDDAGNLNKVRAYSGNGAEAKN